jgi:hypothetical protein
VVLVTFLKLREFGSILFHSEDSVSFFIVGTVPHLVALVCVPLLIDHLFSVLIFQFIDFGLLQVKVQIVSKCMKDYIIICSFDCWFLLLA